MTWHLSNISQDKQTKTSSFNKFLGLPYFEGWYHKFTCNENKTSFILIFGYLAHRNEKNAFIQVASSVDRQVHYYKFSIDELKISKNTIRLGENFFNRSEVFLNLPNIKMNCRQLSTSTSTINTSFIGLKKFVPFVDCKHEVLSFDSMLQGEITYNQKTYKGKFTHYSETSWGKTFPENYFWLHANCFENNPNASFLIARAKPKFLGIKSNQILGYFHHNNEICVFRTGNTKMEFNAAQKTIELRNKTISLQIKYKKGLPVSLKGPRNGQMQNNVIEHIHATTTIQLKKRNEKRIILRSDLGTWEER